MWQRRYPFSALGARAVAPFAVAGFVGGWLLVSRLWHTSPPLGAVLSALLAGITAFHVYSSQGPQRPPSPLQAAVADGVVSGVIASVSTGVILALTSSGADLGFARGLAALAGTGLAGGAVGGLLGLALALTTSDDLLRREPPRERTRRKRSRSARRRRSR